MSFSKKLFIITLNWPAPSCTAAGVRMQQLLLFFKNEGYTITLASTAELSSTLTLEHVDQLLQIQVNNKSFDEYIQALNPDIVLFDRFTAEEQFGWRVATFAPKALRILDTEDLHSLRKTREECHKKNIPFTNSIWLNNDTTKREVASILRSDISLIISNFEMELLTEVLHVSKDILLYLPFMLPRLDPSINKSFKNRKDFVFIGYGGHSPNTDAIIHLKKDIWPAIKLALPKVELQIYGANLPNHIQQFHNQKEGFIINNWAKNANKVIGNAKVLLAPLRFGAGLKGKLVDAMIAGTPNVTTTIGAEGMKTDLPWAGYIENTPIKFAQKAIDLYTNEQGWSKAQDDGYTLCTSLFSKEKFSLIFTDKLKQVSKSLEEHRSKNFYGAMLMHHTMQSTKYMSKWIEAKNSIK